MLLVFVLVLVLSVIGISIQCYWNKYLVLLPDRASWKLAAKADTLPPMLTNIGGEEIH